MIDYTAIIVAFVSLLGVIWQGAHNSKMLKRNEIISELEKTHEEVILISKSQEYVLQDRLLYLCQKYLDRKYLSTMELKLLTNMYHAYHDLGGNEFITELFERCKELPIKDSRD